MVADSGKLARIGARASQSGRKICGQKNGTSARRLSAHFSAPSFFCQLFLVDQQKKEPAIENFAVPIAGSSEYLIFRGN